MLPARPRHHPGGRGPRPGRTPPAARAPPPPGAVPPPRLAQPARDRHRDGGPGRPPTPEGAPAVGPLDAAPFADRARALAVRLPVGAVDPVRQAARPRLLYRDRVHAQRPA